jgi:hypothetical protein
MKAIQVKHLTDCSGYPSPMLLCRYCGATYSASRGDYFAADPETKFKHCGRNMALVIKRVIFEPVAVVD